MANPEIRGRLKPADRKLFEQLKIIYGTQYVPDSETLKRAIRSAHKHEVLKKRIQELFDLEV